MNRENLPKANEINTRLLYLESLIHEQETILDTITTYRTDSLGFTFYDNETNNMFSNHPSLRVELSFEFNVTVIKLIIKTANEEKTELEEKLQSL